MDDARGDVELIAPHRQADERDTRGQRTSHRAHAGVGDHSRRLGEQLGVRRAANHGRVGRRRQRRRVDRRTGGHQHTRVEPAETLDRACQHALLGHVGGAQTDDDERAGIVVGPGRTPLLQPLRIGEDRTDVANVLRMAVTVEVEALAGQDEHALDVVELIGDVAQRR